MSKCHHSERSEACLP